MKTAAADNGIQFSTDLLPERHRLPYLREVFGRSIVGLDFKPFQDCPLEWTASLHAFKDLLVVSGRTAGIVEQRTRSLLADGKDDLLLTINRSGVRLASQAGRECRLDLGSATLLSSADVGGLDSPCAARYLTLLIPRRRLKELTVNPEDALARPIPANSEALRLLVDYVETALERHQLTSPQLRQLFTTHVHDLIALSLRATRETLEAVQDRGLRAARLGAIKSHILDQLDDEGLSVTGVAKRYGVTARYVQMLFESDGTTFTEYVLAQRLTLACRMLVEPARRNRTISAIAFEVGFGNLSYFNRVFRRKFGMTPSDARRAGCDETSV
jgi:AraC-like DNA-binding protein